MKRATMILVTAVAFLALPASAALADERGERGERGEKETVQVPAQVHDSIKNETAGAKITDIERREDNGEVVYEIEFEKAGKNYEMDIAPDGTVLRKDRS